MVKQTHSPVAHVSAGILFFVVLCSLHSVPALHQNSPTVGCGSATRTKTGLPAGFCHVKSYSVGRFLRLMLPATALPAPALCSIMARTLSGSPKSVMKPCASLWSYSSPVVNEAMSSL